ncbi:carbohydrate ABC transporter permease [Luteipulveratus sp. YIM 133132]|uniref:Carbohydrate ABC transporter permease n=1 Tax=Luteipulveratus flavus TaxID=3031728 RepID=A0ABT6C6H9_9MICO|nr:MULTISPECIES: carbohydrate ABC transporter permease [unclassified Luteipulveratus]MDE9365220.1 carbohydrate ABC transporter permease [Luteipulveratus sp. YIM 133132]MDF8264443.1 carbohydrate ABC transporter permease [Luteipulveratus sp. YIM 133296]
MSRHALQERVFGIGRWVVIALLLVVTLFPFLYMVLLSFVPIERLLEDPARLWYPLKDFTTDTYRTVLKPEDEGGQGFTAFIRNSLIVAGLATIITLVVSILGAYAVARLSFFGRRTISALFLSVYLFPVIVLAIPLVILFSKVGLAGSLVGLMLVYVVQTIPISIHMLRNYFRTIPQSVEESAAIDGAGRFQVLTRITLPLAMPSIMSTALFVFMIAWNEFLFALLFLAAKREDWTVSLGLSQLANGVEVPKTVLMAGSVVLTLPIIVLYLAAERWLTEGLTSGADKG